MLLSFVRPPDLRDLIAVCPVFRPFFYTFFYALLHAFFGAAFGLPALESVLLLGLTLGAAGGGAAVAALIQVVRLTGALSSLFTHPSLLAPVSQLSFS
jgi:hypothetical protein